MSTSTFTLRAPTDDDVPGLVELERIWNERSNDGWTTTPEEIVHTWGGPGFDKDRMIRLAEVGDRIVGVFWIHPAQNNEGRSRGFVHPDTRGRGIGSALLDWSLDTSRELGFKTLFTSSDEEDSFSLFERAGFTYARTFHRMVNRDPAETAQPVWPDGIRLVSLEGQELIDAVAEALDGSFIDHWNFKPTDREELAHELADPNEDAALWFVAYGGDHVAGCNICHLNRSGDVVRGHLGPIGTTRPFRGIGLGRALLRHGVLEMAARGALEVSLGVDSLNPNGALGLYERNGFTKLGDLRVFEIHP
jgi:mycothiol synthase